MFSVMLTCFSSLKNLLLLLRDKWQALAILQKTLCFEERLAEKATAKP